MHGGGGLCVRGGVYMSACSALLCVLKIRID